MYPYIIEIHVILIIMGQILIFFKLTEGYSGSDIKLVCKEAAMKSVRQVFDRLESFSTKSPSDSEASFTKNIEIQPRVRTKEVKDAIASTKPSATVLANRYLDKNSA